MKNFYSLLLSVVSYLAVQRSLFTSCKQIKTMGHRLVLFQMLFWATSPLLAQTTWTGGINTAWTNAANWTAGVPDASDFVTIPDVATNPIISAAGALARSITVQSGGVLTISAAGTLALNNGDWAISNYGTVTTSGTITSSNAIVSGIINYAIFSNSGGEIIVNNYAGNGIYNVSGTFANTGTISIGNLASSGITGIMNDAVFNNNAGGKINIDGTNSRGIWNYIGGIFSNQARITIGATASTGQGLRNNAVFNNNAGGQIDIDRSTASGIGNYGSGTFTNLAMINIGAVESAGTDAIDNNAVFVNSAGQINIISTSGGINNSNGSTFDNFATITFGPASKGSVFISNLGNFNNNAGQLIMNGSPLYGLRNFSDGIFTNNATITIGSTSGVTRRGIYNTGTLNNNTGSRIQIDGSSDAGFYNEGTISNAAEITIGSIVSVGQNGIFNIPFFNNNTGNTGGVINNNTGGLIKIDGCTENGIISYGTFVNNATLTIGGTSSVGAYGIYALGAFTNSGEINVDRTTTAGIGAINRLGRFINFNTIRIGAAAGVGAYGIHAILGNFTNQSGAQLHIDHAGIGVYVELNGYFANVGNITIGALAPVNDLIKLKYAASSSPIFEHLRGTIKGSGTLSEGYIFEGGILAPGNSPGIMTIESPANGLNFGTISMEVNGTGTPGVNYDQIVALKTVNLKNIKLALSINYTPVAGDQVTILTATARTNTFEEISGLPANWFVNYTPTAVILSYGPGPLPVDLVSFSGKKTAENQNTLQWITANEKDFDRFEIQRSMDAKSFETMGVVLRQKGTNEIDNDQVEQALHAYTFADNAPGTFNYYRLKMVDLDGTFKFSRIISIEHSVEHTVLGSFYPNPSSGKVFMDVFVLESGRCTLTIFDAGGKRIGVEAHDLQKGMNKISLNRLSPGMNLVRFDNGLFSEVRKVIRE